MTVDLTNATETAEMLREHAAFTANTELTDEQRAKLSQALFPETHTDEVTILGKKRELRPVPVKISRNLNARLQAFQTLMRDAEKAGENVDLDVLDHLSACARVLADFYGWEDVTKAVEEEELLMSELQTLVVQQLNHQDANDFLLMPLRALVAVMQQAEMVALRLQSTSSGRGSASTGAAPSTT